MKSTAEGLPLFLTIEETANICRVAPVTIRKWRAAGKLPGAVRIHGRALTDRDQLLAWITGGSPEGGKSEAPA